MELNIKNCCANIRRDEWSRKFHTIFLWQFSVVYLPQPLPITATTTTVPINTWAVVRAPTTYPLQTPFDLCVCWVLPSSSPSAPVPPPKWLRRGKLLIFKRNFYSSIKQRKKIGEKWKFREKIRRNSESNKRSTCKRKREKPLLLLLLPTPNKVEIRNKFYKCIFLKQSKFIIDYYNFSVC